MPYDTLIQRSDVDARIPETVSNAMLETLRADSAALALGTRIQMPSGTLRFPVLSALPMAYWVNGDTGLKQTSTAAWDKKFINVEELAVIVPIPDNVIDDASFDVWGEVQPLMEAAIARKIDAAVFLDVDNPASFPDGLSAQADAIGNEIVRGTATAAAGGIHADIEALVALLEDEGYTPTGGIARAGLRSLIRRTKIVGGGDNAIGQGAEVGDWFGAAMTYPLAGLWPTAVSTTEAIIGDFSQLVVGVRRDFTYKLLTESVITDDSTPPQIVFNLPQQDMVAMRLTFRMGWQVANPINYEEPDEASRFPFARLVRPAA